MINFFIHGDTPRQEIEFLLKTWAKNTNTSIEFVTNDQHAVTVGRDASAILTLSKNFASTTLNNNSLNSHSFLEDNAGKADFLATAFYMLNSCQEYNDNNPDELGRFRFKSSYQFQFNNASQNIVQQCFDEISKVCNVPPRNEKTRFFLTHDIDSVNGAIIEDGFNVLKKGRIDLFLKMLFHVAIQKPDWLNMDKIMALESEYDCKSVFYWLVNQGRINKREANADYAFSSTAIQEAFQLVEANGFENGIHKSISPETLTDETQKFGKLPVGNRYHYLKFNLPDMYNRVEQAKLKLDASLGFAEAPGFRNSYGLPFNPFNMEKQEAFSFVEVPLHVMDRTFFQYKRCNVQDAEKEIIDFFEKNRKNCVLSVLWHNNFFTDYKFKGYLDLYKKILGYIKENDFKTITQEEIIHHYSIA